MTVILVLLTFAIFLLIDYFKTRKPAAKKVVIKACRGTEHTTLGFEHLGCLAQDGGEPFEPTQLQLPLN